MSEHQIDRLREIAAANDPSDAARARMGSALDQHIAAAPSAPSPARAKRRVPRIALGATLAAAAAIAVVFALSPSDSTSERYGFTAPDTAAAAALVDAGEAAADSRWTPLGDDGYFHVYSTSFELREPGEEAFHMGPSTYEVWMRRDGSGQSINVMGGEYPQRYMRIGYDGAGKIMNIGGSTLPKGPKATEAQALRNPDQVTLMTYPRDGSPGFQYGWLRQPKRYAPTFSGPNSGSHLDGVSDADLRLLQTWGLSLEQLDRIPTASGEQQDATLAELLTGSPDSPFLRGRIATGAYGQDQADIDREHRIHLATMLLGSAPLAPNARRSIFRWLAQQPGATLTQGVTDRIGRVGNRVTFSSKFDAQVRGRRVTVQTIIDEAIAAGARDITPETVVRLIDTSSKPVRKSIDRNAKVSLPTHRQQRTWKVELIIDPDTGELLQYGSSERSKSTSTVPRLSWHPKSGLQLYVSGGGGNSFGGGGAIYRKRESTSKIVPLSPVCSGHPEVCAAPATK